MNNLGSHSLDVMVYIFFAVPDWSAELAARHDFCLDILRLARRLGVEFAFPTQTLHLTRAEESAPYPTRHPRETLASTGNDAAAEVLTPPTQSDPTSPRKPSPQQGD